MSSHSNLQIKTMLDDFVLTLSDNEPDGQLSGTEDVNGSRSFTKRKSYGDGAANDNGGSDTGNNKRRKPNKAPPKAEKLDVHGKRAGKKSTKRPVDAGAEIDGGHSSPPPDGELDPGFEFDGLGLSNEVLPDLDGWTVDQIGLTGSFGPGSDKRDRKGVDIDVLIARRQRHNEDVFSRAHSGVDGLGRESASSALDSDFNGFDEDGEVANGDVHEMDEVKDEGETEDSEVDLMLEGPEEEGEADENDFLATDAFGMGTLHDAGSEEEDDDDDDGDGDDDDEDEDGSIAEPVPHPLDLEAANPLFDGGDNSDDEHDETASPEERRRREAFFAPEPASTKGKDGRGAGAGMPKPDSFGDLSLSRPILRGLASLGFTTPTPIQAKAIPIALAGTDVVGGAVTGSGKTAAFLVPVLERLLYRPKKIATTRVVLLMPTRELAVQCFGVAKRLASFTDITVALVVGGFSLREQEQVLRRRPDIVIATPGRFIDHMRNSASFAVDTLEILVLDEADRMLEDGFADELDEILRAIPRSRQTMLFSATMTDSVDRLIRAGLSRPVRLMVDAKKQTVAGLVQEFVRLRPGKEHFRLAYLVYLCANVYAERVIVFFSQKREAHKVRILFGLLGFKAAELHGSMTQEQRLQSVDLFRSGAVSFLLATDLASRGLDIKNVTTVINYTAPQSYDLYLHRVGRTARAGRSGCGCTLTADADRKVVRSAVRAARAQKATVRSRAIPAPSADEWFAKIEGMTEELEAILKEEKDEKALQEIERNVKKGENMIIHEEEIMSRPKRTWFESEQAKRAAKLGNRAGSVGGGGGGSSSNGVKTGHGKSSAGPETVRTRRRSDVADGRPDNGRPASASKEASKKKKLSGKDKKKLSVRDERREGSVWKKSKAERGLSAKASTKGPQGGTAKVRKGKAKPTAKATGRPSRPGAARK